MISSSLMGCLDRFHSLGSEIAYVQRDGYRSSRWSYREVAELSYRFSRELERRCIRKGDRVCLWGRNSAEWVAAFLGCIARGAVVVPMDTIASADFAHRVFQQVEGRLWVCSREQALNTAPGETLRLEGLRETLDRHESTPYCFSELSDGDMVQIVFTSGTTADPKGVIISHGNILANLEPLRREIRKYLKYERFVHPLRFLDLLPLSHVFGQFMSIFIPQLLGATVVFHESLNPSEIMHTIKRERVSVVVTVPRLMETLRDKIERDQEVKGLLSEFRMRFAAAEKEHFIRRWWRFRKIHGEFGWKFWAFISGGAALDAETERFWGRLGFAVIQGYGLTETTSLISVNHPFKLGKGSIGKVLPGREIRLDSNGEILVRGNNIAVGYYQGKELRPVAGQEGWFHTGDVGELDPEGNLYFKGRKKNVIVTPEGLKIYPEDLEAALRRQPEIRDCAVIGVSHNGNAEPCAVLILNTVEADAESAVNRASDSLAGFQRIRNWMIWPEKDFPRTATQKPRISLIQELAQSRFSGRAGQTSAPGGVADLISRITGKPVGVISPDANLARDLNLSSVDRVELLSALEDRYQLDLNETRFTSATTLADLEKMLHQPLPQRSDYQYPHWAQRPLVSGLRLIVYYLLTWPATRLLSYPRIRGLDHLKGVRQPLLFISNHITQVDVGFLLAALPLRYRHRLAVAMWGELLQSMREPPANMGFLKRSLERLSYWLVVALFNTFPLPQQSGFRASFAFAGETADRGYSILVFPEGQRTRDGKLSAFRTGIGILAKNLGLRVVPMRIDGLFELKRKNQKLSRPGSVTVTIGEPVRFSPEDEPEWITRELERLVASMQVSSAKNE